MSQEGKLMEREAQRRERARIDKMIATLAEVPAFQEYRKEVERLIATHTPTVDNVTSTDQMASITVKMAVCTGLRLALKVVERRTKL